MNSKAFLIRDTLARSPTRKRVDFFWIITALIGLFGCAPSIDYTLITVPDEGPVKITQVTVDKDSVSGCKVYWKDKSWSYDVRNRISVSSDGSKIAFMTREGGAAGITVKMLDGSGRSYRKPEQGEAIDPCLSADGKKLAFARCANASWNLYETFLEGGPAVRRLTNDNFFNVYPQYFPDSAQLLFNHVELRPGMEKDDVIPDSKLWATNLPGPVITEYGDGFASSFVPKNKNKVVTVRCNGATHTTELRIVDLVSGEERMLFGQKGRGIADPSVSPSGNVVAFVSMTEDKRTPANLDVYTINTDGTQLKCRTFFPGQDICPRWSGDGGSLYFLSQRGTKEGVWNVWKMDLPEYLNTPAAGRPQSAQAGDTSKQAPQPPATSSTPDSAGQKAVSPSDSARHTGSIVNVDSVKPGDGVAITLTDGTIITGVIVTANKNAVVLNASGAQQTISTDTIKKISPSPQTIDTW
jgi:Tol biopolymer transport system component